MTVEVKEKRPVFLLVLCILSFVYIGFSLLSGAAVLAVGPSSEKVMAKEEAKLDKEIAKLEKSGGTSMIPMMEKFKSFARATNKKFYGIEVVSLLVSALGLFAVIKMLTGYKIGFHLYIMYSLISVCQIYIFVSPTMVPTILVVLKFIASGGFVGMYAANLRWMR